MSGSRIKIFFAYLSLTLIAVLATGLQNRAAAQTPSPEPAAARITYDLKTFKGGIKELRQLFNDRQLELLQKINRTDLKHLTRLRDVMVPSVWSDNELDYSPFPARYPRAANIAKLLVVDVSAQAFGAYENGSLVRWGPVSTGRKKSPTPAGLFHLTWRSRARHSTVDREWYMQWYFNFDNKAGLSLHQYDLPGYPASHECIRLLESDARWVYDWGEEWILGKKPWQVLKLGTPLLILNQYAYGSKPPLWRSKEWLAKGVQLPDAPIPR